MKKQKTKENGEKQMSRFKAGDIVQISVFSALMVLCSWIYIPAVVPFTMQTFGVLLAAVLLGAKKSIFAVLVYMLLGVLGLPVFSGGGSGIGVLLGQNGGYIMGFLICAFVCGKISEKTKRSPAAMMISMLAGLLCVYVFGGLWLACVYLSKSGDMGVWTVVCAYTASFVIPDLIKITLATFTARRFLKSTDLFRR